MLVLKLSVSALGGFVIGAVGTVLLFRRYLPTIVHQYNTSLTHQHEIDMARFYEMTAKDKFTHPCKLNKTLLHTLCLYDPTDPALPSLQGITHVKRRVDCLFAKTAVAWGSAPWNPQLTLEENVLQSRQAFTLFMSTQRGVDGFVFEIPSKRVFGELDEAEGDFGDTVDHFGETVRRVLKALSDHDPAGWHCMDKSFIHKKGWVFKYNEGEAFVTTFAPCYPDTHPRHNFNHPSCFILFQPYSSFLHHDIGDDSPHTNWKNPQNMRDRIRIRFYANHRPYVIRDMLSFPICEDIVRPLGLHDPPIPWYLPLADRIATEGATRGGGEGGGRGGCPFLQSEAEKENVQDE